MKAIVVVATLTSFLAGFGVGALTYRQSHSTFERAAQLDTVCDLVRANLVTARDDLSSDARRRLASAQPSLMLVEIDLCTPPATFNSYDYGQALAQSDFAAIRRLLDRVIDAIPARSHP